MFMIENLHDEIDVILVLFPAPVNDLIELLLREIDLSLLVEYNDIDLHDIAIEDVPACLLLGIVIARLLHAYESLAREDQRVALECVHLLDRLCHEHVQVYVVQHLQSDRFLLVVGLKLHAEAYESRGTYLCHRFVVVLLEKFICIVDNGNWNSFNKLENRGSDFDRERLSPVFTISFVELIETRL